MQHMMARLTREIPVQLVDISLSGCLVATDHPLAHGLVAELCVTLEGKPYRDTLQLRRSASRSGERGHRFLTAGEFAWRNRPGTASLRGTVPQTLP